MCTNLIKLILTVNKKNRTETNTNKNKKNNLQLGATNAAVSRRDRLPELHVNEQEVK